MAQQQDTRRILIIDDNAAIQDDFRKILLADVAATAISEARTALFEEELPSASVPSFEIECAAQGETGYAMVKQAKQDGRPYEVTFVDMRMPAGWDGLETVEYIWGVDSAIQVVICTAFSDYDWHQIIKRLGQNDKLLILRKPFDAVEVRQLACALSQKWRLARQAQQQLDCLSAAVNQRTAELQMAKEQLERDLARRIEMEHELIKARDQALEAARLKSVFLATMSHEIRTPMNGVIGMTGLLLETGLDEEQREYAEIVKRSGEHLLTILNDILDFSRIEAGKVTLETIDFDLRQAIQESVDLLSGQASSKGLNLAYLIHAEVPSGVRGDPGRLRQVMTNLVSNAIKFTERGEVVIDVRLEEKPPKDQSGDIVVRFSVADTGIGLTGEDQARLFTPFVQVDGSTTRKHGGTGLGLAISKQLVELMGGLIGIKSEPGRGSTFWFTVRLGQQANTVNFSTLPMDHQDSLRVCIINDNATNQRILNTYLLNWGMQVLSAENGSSALELLRMAVSYGTLPDAILLSMQLREMDWRDVARTLQADGLLKSIPVILMTTFGQQGDIQEAKGFGISAYLPWPIHQSDLYNCLVAVAGSHTAGPGASKEDPEEARTNLPIVTRHTLAEAKSSATIRVLLAEDNVINQKVAVQLLAKLGCRTDVVANGMEAIEATQRVSYDLVFMDCLMPEMDGFIAASEIRGREKAGQHVPIIAMTANAMKGDREKCLNAGMDDCISKPVQLQALADMLKRWGLTDAPRSSASNFHISPLPQPR